MSSLDERVATLIRQAAAALAEQARLRDAVETEWYNGNMDEGARDRILKGPKRAALAPGTPVDVE